MTSGRKAYDELNRQVDALRRQTSQQSSKLAQISAEMERIQAQEGQGVARLARFRLDELAARQLGDSLGSAEREAMVQIAQRQVALERCERRLAESDQRQNELEDQRRQAVHELDQLREQLQSEHDAVVERSRADPNWQRQTEHSDRLAGQAALAREKAEQAQADRSAKGQPYDADTLFTYLWSRQYGSAGYRAGRIARALDGWVANLIGYRDAARNYRLLTALPEKLGQHAERIQAEADQARQDLEALERQALEQAGVLALAERVEQAEGRIERLAGQIESEERAHAALRAERAVLAEGEDEHTRKALAILSRAIDQATLPDLHSAARSTPSPEDDAAVTAIEHARRARERLSLQLAASKTEHEQSLAALTRVEELRRKFRESGYDSSDSEFDTGMDLRAMLGSLMKGVLEGARAWERVQRHQRFRVPRSSGGSIVRTSTSTRSSTRSSSSGGAFGGGIFKSGGGFGGGGFKSGGGF